MNFQKIAIKKILVDNDKDLLLSLNSSLFVSNNLKKIFIAIQKYFKSYGNIPEIDTLKSAINNSVNSKSAKILNGLLDGLYKIDSKMNVKELLENLEKEKVINSLDTLAPDLLDALENKEINRVSDILKIIDEKIKSVNSNIAKDIRDTKVNITSLSTVDPFLPSLKENGVDLIGLTIVASESGCVDENTEFLTPKGWKKIKDFTKGDLVFEVNPFNNYNGAFSEPVDYIKKYDNRLAYRVYPDNRSKVSMFVTYEHKMVYERNEKNSKNKRPVKVTCATDFFNKITVHNYIPSKFLPTNLEGVSFTDDEIRFIVAFCADGSKGSKNTVRFNLKKITKQNRLESLLNRLKLKYTVQIKDNGYKSYNVKISFNIIKGLHKYFWGANLYQLKIISDEIPYWDGSFSKRTGLPMFFTTNKEEADFVQYAFGVIFQKDVAINTHNMVGDKYKTGGKYYYRKSIDYTVRVNTTEGKIVRKDKVKLEKLPNSMKYCFTTNTGFWLARKDDYIFVTGNSGKSIFSLNQALHTYSQGKKVSVHSLELPVDQVLMRLYSMQTNTPYKELRDKPKEELEKILQEWKDTFFDKDRFFIANKRYNVDELLESVEYDITKRGVDLVVIDYLNLVSQTKTEEEWRGLSNLVKKLHDLTIKYGVVILSPTQINLSENKNKKVEFTVRGSMELLYSSSILLFIYQNIEEYKENVARVIVKKSRVSRKFTSVVKTEFDKMKFTDMGVIIDDI